MLPATTKRRLLVLCLWLAVIAAVAWPLPLAAAEDVRVLRFSGQSQTVQDPSGVLGTRLGAPNGFADGALWFEMPSIQEGNSARRLSNLGSASGLWLRLGGSSFQTAGGECRGVVQVIDGGTSESGPAPDNFVFRSRDPGTFAGLVITEISLQFEVPDGSMTHPASLEVRFPGLSKISSPYGLTVRGHSANDSDAQPFLVRFQLLELRWDESK
jgi:hypothetical protein